jgi:acyl carrier protein
MAVMAMIEDEYSVKIPNFEFRNCNTVGEIYALVESKSKTE